MKPNTSTIGRTLIRPDLLSDSQSQHIPATDFPSLYTYEPVDCNVGGPPVSLDGRQYQEFQVS